MFAALRSALTGSLLVGFSALTAQTPAATTVDGRPACARCRISITKIARIGAAQDSVIPGLEARIAVTSTGEIYATSGFTIIRYDKQGKFVGTFLRRGSGPGEIDRRDPMLLVGPGDTLFVVNGSRAMVFTPKRDFVRSHAMRTSTSVTLTGNGRMVGTGVLMRDTSATTYPLHLYSKLGAEIERSFGASARMDARCAWCMLFALTGAVDGSSVWMTRAERYELTRWDLNGKLLDQVAFTGSPWFREWDPNPQRGTPGLVTRVMDLAQVSASLLWIRAIAPLANASATASNADFAGASSSSDQYFNVASIIDAYDPARRRVIATLSLPRQDARVLPGGLLAIRGESPSGLVYFDICRLSVSEN